MKQWLEINITINGFTYAVRKEVESISEIWKAGEDLSHRLQDIIDNRETKLADKIIDYYKKEKNGRVIQHEYPIMKCLVKPNVIFTHFGKTIEYIIPKTKEIFTAYKYTDNNHYFLISEKYPDGIVVRKEDCIESKWFYNDKI